MNVPTHWQRARRLLLLALTLLVVTASSVAYAGQAPGPLPPADPLDPIIDNGSLVQLGINPTGALNVGGGTPSY